MGAAICPLPCYMDVIGMGKHDIWGWQVWFHYIVLTALLFLYHFYIGMSLLDMANGFYYYTTGFFAVLVGTDITLHKVLGLD